jgi:MFS family permease
VRSVNRNVLLLSLSNALGMAGAPAVVLLGGIIGSKLAPGPTLSTFPVAAMVVGVAVFTVPAAMLMAKIGRRAGFMLSSVVTSLAALSGIYAIHSASFAHFCLVSFFIGGNMAFVQQYRFAAAESVEPAQVSKAVSFVLLGGIVAGFLGPEIAKRAKDLLPYGLYSGSFAAIATLYLLNTGLLRFLKEPEVQNAKVVGEGRPLGVIVRQPIYLTALFAAMVAYGVMSFIMTATPVSMHVIDNFSIDQTAWVIQSHVLAMFIPSLFTGFLISRFGLPRVMLAGTLMLMGCAVAALVDRHFIHYWTGLVLLGIGWNFQFVGATTLLTRCYSSSERFKAQAFNDFSVFGFQAVASLTAGTVIFSAGWEVLNALSLPLLAVMLVVIWKMGRKMGNYSAG